MNPFPNPTNETVLGFPADRETRQPGSDDRPPPWQEGDRLDEFVLEQLLGCGSSGCVYRALDTNTGQRWALKMLRPRTPDDLLRNKLGFRRMISVDHPNLVAVNRIHQLGSHVALSMEEVPGETFSRARHELRKMDPARSCERLLLLLNQFASGLAELHRRGLLHRDMKPANMMVRRDGTAKIIDYGLVDVYQVDVVQYDPSGYLLGTPRYMAPEVYWSQQYLPSGDIFALGIVFLETLLAIQWDSNRPPAELSRSNESRSEDSQRISDAIAELPESTPAIIRETCTQMLSREPVDRPTANELSRVGSSRAIQIALPDYDSMLGRQPEMEQIRSWVNAIFKGGAGRLHVCGPSGIGKSRLIEEVIRDIEVKKWGQLFYAKCRIREDLPMQAFDQICDAIANRYMRGDRERLEVDPVSFQILTTGFPVLAKVLKARIELSPPGTNRESMDALEAAVRLSEQLRLVGPLFIVIDDSHWADRDSLNTLDRLTSAVGEAGLGIITVSPHADAHRVPPQHTIELGPLDLADSIAFLSRAAGRNKIELPAATIRKLAIAADGSPYRLRELAGEFRSGGALASGNQFLDTVCSDPDAIDQLWQRRVARLGEDARQLLPYVATAGGRMSTRQLGDLSGLHETIDAAISDLVQQRLITDDATGGLCIEIVHDRVAGAMVHSLGTRETKRAHHGWATHLSRSKDAHTVAARIAGHFFAAGEPGQAVSYAIIAAEDAQQRVALYQAARLYRRVASHVSGTERIDHLRNAANCFREAEYPVESAACYQQLAELLEPNERFDCQLLAVELLIRGGRFNEVRSLLDKLAGRLQLPRPKTPGLAMVTLFWHQLHKSRAGRGALLSKLIEQVARSGEQPVRLDRKTSRRLKFCLALIRPLSLVDNLYSAELSMIGTELLIKYGDVPMRINGAVGEAVFACYDQGRGRAFGEAQLSRLKQLTQQIQHPKSSADVAAGTAYSHAFAGRWNQVIEQVQLSAADYRQSSDAVGFDLAQTVWIELWAMWHLGHWSRLRQRCLELHDDAIQRNDGFQKIISNSGLASAGWLLGDAVEALKRLHQRLFQSINDDDPLQLISVFQWAGLTQRLIYKGRYDEAWSRYEKIRPKLRKRPFANMQMIRLLRQQLAVLISLHQLDQCFSEPLVLRVSLLIDELHHEKIPYASLLANLYGGLLNQRIAQVGCCPESKSAAIGLLTTARQQASEQQLLPLQLAASDALARLQTGQVAGHLAALMESEGVVQPKQFQRLVTVDFDL